ncbi:MAG: DUF420 domain-containing protein [Planctomycetota bacterium]|nr:DUF420 domain-containing protein [Planctomycetota bacterium]
MLEKQPLFHGSLNACVSVLLVAGWILIKRKQVGAHKACMIVATLASAVFLASYVVYHVSIGANTTRFTHEGFVRYLYFFILIPHVILAAVTLPMIVKTLWHAYKGDHEKHRRIARWTMPLWLYVAVTGVLVYLMLYVWFPPAAA